jgi:hypothetical protein
MLSVMSSGRHADDGKERRTAKQWLSDDLSKMNRPTTIVSALRTHPRLIAEGAGYAAALAGVLALALLVLRQLDQFDDYVLFAIIGGSLHTGRRIHELKNRAPDRRPEG